jgi:hypothetical protein
VARSELPAAVMLLFQQFLRLDIGSFQDSPERAFTYAAPRNFDSFRGCPALLDKRLDVAGSREEHAFRGVSHMQHSDRFNGVRHRNRRFKSPGACLSGIIVCLLTIFAAVSAQAQTPVVGAWKIDGSVFFNSVDTTCHFKQEGITILGTCENEKGPGEYTPVTLDGAKIRWSWNPGPALLTFDAILTSATTMKGKILVRGFTGSFEATKQ